MMTMWISGLMGTCVAQVALILPQLRMASGLETSSALTMGHCLCVSALTLMSASKDVTNPDLSTPGAEGHGVFGPIGRS
ncbi:hypothetical protein AAFF_G00320980 [Aldrovandia affinis]|uniref:Secreted protein n=1 Tax=Aldrovandia affinis TaxID=143900 RepID=A0AAD7W0D4_9TELE|nr:hypothetical protein AAFF_G00320980 [Aldrovandia affinis]